MMVRGGETGMHIVVCVNTTLIAQDRTVDGIQAAMSNDEEIRYMAEPDSIAAIHFAFSLCERDEDTVTALAYGGAQQNVALEYALASGVPFLYRIEGQQTDTMGVAAALSHWLNKHHADMIVCGQPHGTGALPAMLAGLLDISYVSRVYDLQKDNEQFVMKQRLDRGWRQEIAVAPPALVTVQTGFFSPMYVSVKRRRTAQKQVNNHVKVIPVDEEQTPHVKLKSVKAPKPRAKRKATPASGQSASNRLQSLMGSGGRGSKKSAQSQQNNDDEETIRELDPETAAEEMIKYLRQKGFLSGSSDLS